MAGYEAVLQCNFPCRRFKTPRHLEAILGGAVIEVATHHCLLHLSGRKKRETRVTKKMMHELQYGAYWLDWQLAVW